MTYSALHVHSDYSLLDGMGKVKDIAKRAKELGMPAIALTDHGNMAGSVAFYTACKDEGIKPIIGCEVYICNDRFNKEVKEQYHLVLLAKDEIGYRNLVKLCSKAHTEGFYRKPRIDYTLLQSLSEGLVCLSGCLGGHVPKLIGNGEYDKAEKLVRWHRDVFGDDYYLEVQNHGIDLEETVFNQIEFMAGDLGIKVVATGDSHYVYEEESEAHALLLAMQTKSIVGEEGTYKFEGDGYHIMSTEEMYGKFRADQVENTLEVAEKCNVTLDMNTNHYPVFPHDGDNNELLLQKTVEGAKGRYGQKDTEFKRMAWERMQYELSIIGTMGFVDYFLVVSDFIGYAREQGIPVGAGRGSGAGSVVAFCCGITDICPIDNGLLFERFLNPDRSSNADFDIDFCEERRDEVIDYVRGKYTGVSRIGTYGSLKLKSAIKDISRTLGYEIEFANKLSDSIIDADGTFESELEDNPDFRSMFENSEQAREVVKYGKSLLNIKKSAGQHACGVIIADYDISEVVPTMLATDTRTGEKHECTQLDAPECESLGLLKMDFLGLKTLTVCQRAISNATENGTQCPSFEEIPLEDELAYKLIQSGDTSCIFQIESDGMQETCKSIKPLTLGHLSDILALYRPGPMQYIPTYVARKNGEEVEYAHPALEKITGATYGIMVYQEQIMQLVQAIAGLSLAQSDILRRAIGKKKADLLAEQKQVFVNGARDNGVDPVVSESIWEDILKFADYGFNKSHSIAYAVLTARTAYLKAHHPAEFLSACMCSEKDMEGISSVIAEAKRMGIKIEPPNINTSKLRFHSDGKSIFYGLSNIKGIGESAVQPIIDEREVGGEFTSFFDLWNRCRPNKKAIEALAKAGALDQFGSRSAIIENIADIMKQIAHFKKVETRLEKRKEEVLIDYSDKRNKRNLDLMASAQDDYENLSFDIPYAEPLTKKEILKYEMQSIGCYISGHPLDEWEDVYETDLIADIEADGGVTLLVNILSVDIKNSKKGSKYGRLGLMSLEEQFEGMIFSKSLANYKDMLIVGDNVIVQGTVKRDTPTGKGVLFINKIGECK